MTQPVHTVYGGAHLFRADTAPKLGRLALRALDEHPQALPAVPAEVLERVRQKLLREPVEDLRIDFEDGYGVRSESDELAHARAAAGEVAAGYLAGSLPRMLGIRIKPLHEGTRTRALSTLRAFFEALPEPPAHFTVTLPKVRNAREVEELRTAMAGITRPDVSIELMIETSEALRDLRGLLDAALGRCRGLHFGPFDFTSSCGIVSAAQELRHPLCTYARNRMLVETAGSKVWLSDGPTSLLPVGSTGTVALAWRTQWDDIQHSLATGFYQGWDLHPAQLPVRYAAVYSFFLEHLPAARARLANFESQQQQATRLGAAFDDAATVLGLRAFLERAAASGAADAGS